MPRVAIVGSGIAGLAAAHRLAPHAALTLFEAQPRFGGHAHTVDVTLDGRTHGIDIAFLSIHRRTYPRLLALLDTLGVEVVRSELNFSVQVPRAGIEWSGPRLNALFAQRRNLCRPGFWHMLREVLRFNRLGRALRRAQPSAGCRLPGSVGEFLREHRFRAEFSDWYLLPILGSVWGCPISAMLDFPAAAMLRFFDTHGLLDRRTRDPWSTIRGGSRQYVDRIVQGLRQRGADLRAGTPVRRIVPAHGAQPVQVCSERGIEHFDAVVLACHGGQSLALLAAASAQERKVLGATACHRNRIVIHRDTSLLPRQRRAWAAWNYEHPTQAGQERHATCVHYWLNRLQPTPFRTPLVVSLNPWREPRGELVIEEHAHAHPLFTSASLAAQEQLPALQGRAGVWFCGAWTGNGFHEDGLCSGLDTAGQVLAHLEQAVRPVTPPPEPLWQSL